MDQEAQRAWHGRRRLSAERVPLWRGRHASSPEKLRRRFELYIEEFERYVETRRAV